MRITTLPGEGPVSRMWPLIVPPARGGAGDGGLVRCAPGTTASDAAHANVQARGRTVLSRTSFLLRRVAVLADCIPRRCTLAKQHAEEEWRPSHRYVSAVERSSAAGLTAVNQPRILRARICHARTSDVTHNAVPPSISVMTTMSQSGRYL